VHAVALAGALAALVALAYQTRAAYITSLLTRKGDPFVSDFLGKSKAQILNSTLHSAFIE
jgi:hypothetical protein